MAVEHPALSACNPSAPARSAPASSSTFTGFTEVQQISASVALPSSSSSSSSLHNFAMARAARGGSVGARNMSMSCVTNQGIGSLSNVEGKTKLRSSSSSSTTNHSYSTGSVCYGATIGAAAATSGAVRLPNSVPAATAGAVFSASSWSSCLAVPPSTCAGVTDRDRISRSSSSHANKSNNMHHSNSYTMHTNTSSNNNNTSSAKTTNISTGSSGPTFITAATTTSSSSSSLAALVPAAGATSYRVTKSSHVDVTVNQQQQQQLPCTSRPPHSAQLTHSNPASATLHGISLGASAQHAAITRGCRSSIQSASQMITAKGTILTHVSGASSGASSGNVAAATTTTTTMSSKNNTNNTNNIVQHLARHLQQQQQQHGCIGGSHHSSHPVVITTSGATCTSSRDVTNVGATVGGGNSSSSTATATAATVSATTGGVVLVSGQPPLASSSLNARNTNTSTTSMHRTMNIGGTNSSANSNYNTITATANMAAMDRGGMLRNAAPHYTRPLHYHPDLAEAGGSNSASLCVEGGGGSGIAGARPTASPSAQFSHATHVDAAVDTMQMMHSHQQQQQQQSKQLVVAQPVSSQQPLLPRPRVMAYGSQQHNLPARRKPMDCPNIALSVGIMTLYRGINVKYWRRRRVARPGTKYNNGYDDKAGFYIPMLGEEVVSRYTVQEILGQGSFGIVLRCVDQKYQEQVAMKIIRSGSYFTAQGRLEAEIVAYLNCNPYLENRVVQLRKVFDWQGHVVLVFELLSYNLYQLLKTTCFNGISLDLTRKFAYQLLQVLLQLEKHDPPIIHCDLKPENVVLRDRCRSGLRVIDFGSSCYQQVRVWSPPAPPPPLPVASSSDGAADTERAADETSVAHTTHTLHAPLPGGGNGNHLNNSSSSGCNTVKACHKSALVPSKSSNKSNTGALDGSRVQLPKYIQSRFYRSPEVIMELGYTAAIDRWSLGCMLVELHTGVPLFPGRHETDMLAHFTAILGALPRHMIATSPKRDLFYCEQRPLEEKAKEEKEESSAVGLAKGGHLHGAAGDAAHHSRSGSSGNHNRNKAAVGVFTASPLFTVEIGSYTVGEKTHVSSGTAQAGGYAKLHPASGPPALDADVSKGGVLVGGGGGSTSASQMVQNTNANAHAHRDQTGSKHTQHGGTHASTMYDCHTVVKPPPMSRKPSPQSQASQEHFRYTPGTQSMRQAQPPPHALHDGSNNYSSNTNNSNNDNNTHAALIREDKEELRANLLHSQTVAHGDTMSKSHGSGSRHPARPEAEEEKECEVGHTQTVVCAEHSLWPAAGYAQSSPPPSSIAAVSEKSPRSTSHSAAGLQATVVPTRTAIIHNTVTSASRRGLGECASGSGIHDGARDDACPGGDAADEATRMSPAERLEQEEQDMHHPHSNHTKSNQYNDDDPNNNTNRIINKNSCNTGGDAPCASLSTAVNAHTSGRTAMVQGSSGSDGYVHGSHAAMPPVHGTHTRHGATSSHTNHRGSEVRSHSYAKPLHDTTLVSTTTVLTNYVLKRPPHPSMCQSMETILGVHTGGPRGCRRDQPGHDVHSYLVFLDFVQRLLRYDPRERMSCAEALAHPFLRPLLEQEARVASEQKHPQQQQPPSDEH